MLAMHQSILLSPLARLNFSPNYVGVEKMNANLNNLYIAKILKNITVRKGFFFKSFGFMFYMVFYLFAVLLVSLAMISNEIFLKTESERNSCKVYLSESYPDFELHF